jgi:hypothetical protein
VTSGLLRRHPIRAACALVAVVLAIPGVSIGQALTRPGNDTVAERLAEWARDHHGGAVVNLLERASYHPPKVGGRPPPSSPLLSSPGVSAAPTQERGLPAPLQPIAAPPLPGEGAWRVLAERHGRPALAVTYLRPDAAHTSYTSMVAWINPDLVQARWHPGTSEPGGGPWPARPDLVGADRSNLLAAFNSAFRLQDARGGVYAFGRTRGRLRTGAASLVLDRQGRIDVGAWGQEVSMTPSTQVVRQNLVLLVDGGLIAPGISSNKDHRWGATLGNSYYVWRSGIGVTADGAAVYVAGDRLNAESLAVLLQRAGAVRAMELDINRDWTSFVLYRGPAGRVAEHNALPDMRRSPTRYDSPSSRDFVALYLRR